MFLSGSTPARTPVVSERDRDELHDLLRYALDEYDATDTVRLPHPPVTPAIPVDADTPFGHYRASTTWQEILTGRGWTEAFTAADGRTHWTRPGKDVRDGTSATSLEDGPLYVFTTSTVLPTEQGLSKEYVYAALAHGGDLTAASAHLRAAGYGTPAPVHPPLSPWLPAAPATPPDPLAAPGEPVDVNALRAAWIREHFPHLDWTTLWADEQDEEWIIEPLIPARRLIALYSAPKVGKSLLLLEIAAAIATGKGMFGYPATGLPRRVLYVDMENDPRGDTRSRLIDMGYGPEHLDNIVMLSFPTLAFLDTPAGAAQLLAIMAVYDCEVVVIDTVSRVIGGEENENDTWLNFYRHTGLALKQAGKALIRLDHSGKDETKGQRGGSAKSGDVDAVWRLHKVSDDLFDLDCEAMRFPVTEQHLTLRRMENPLRHDVVGDGYRVKRDDLLARLAEARVAKDPGLGIREIRVLVRAAGVTFKNSQLSTELWARYCQTPATWVPETLTLETDI
jgi:hypothetical protein